MANPFNTVTVDGKTYDAEAYAISQALNKPRTANDALGKDAFLSLLVTQMQYQDPLDPQDNSEYLSQLANFSALEQMTNVSEAVNKVYSLVENIDTSVLVGQLSGMIDKEIQWTSSSSTPDAEGNVTYSSDTYVGKVTGVSMSDGAPSVIAKVISEDGRETVHKVAIGDITRVGDAG